MTREALSEDIRDGWQAVARLVRRDVMDVGCAREVRLLIGDMARRRLRVVPAGERLAQRSGLDDSFMRELLVRRCYDAQSRGSSTLLGKTGRLGRELSSVPVGVVRPVSLRRLLLQSLLNDLPLVVANRQATLELLLHDGILRDETGRKAGDTNFLDA